MEKPVPTNVPSSTKQQARSLQWAGMAILSPKEIVTLVLIARGHSNAEIAKALHLSPFTVKNRLEAIYAKLNAHNRANAVARGFLVGALTSESLDKMP